MATMPHCDPLILHAPGECKYCDECPNWQHFRKTWGIAFTGHPPKKGELPCPSEVRRSTDVTNAWPGNRPSLSTPSVDKSHELPHFRPTQHPIQRPTQHPTLHPTTQLGRPNVPDFKRDLDAFRPRDRAVRLTRGAWPVSAGVRQYRKCPVVIEAIQWTGDNFADVIEFIGESFLGAERGDGFDQIYIETLNGVMTANLGWWIIKDVHGEFYPYEPEIFSTTYEEYEEYQP